MMRKICIFIVLCLCSLFSYAQAPTRYYGEYKYVYSLNAEGDAVTVVAFPRIQPIVVTTNFLGIIQSEASYMYMALGGTWLNSANFSWGGYRNGWYIYVLRMGTGYSYLLISSDFDTVRIQESFNKGVTHVYEKCDPNEMMNNAPIN